MLQSSLTEMQLGPGTEVPGKGKRHKRKQSAESIHKNFHPRVQWTCEAKKSPIELTE